MYGIVLQKSTFALFILILLSVEVGICQSNPYELRFRLEMTDAETDSQAIPDVESDTQEFDQADMAELDTTTAMVPDDHPASEQINVNEPLNEEVDSESAPIDEGEMEDMNPFYRQGDSSVDEESEVVSNAVKSVGEKQAPRKSLFIFLTMVMSAIMTMLTLTANKQIVNNVVSAVRNDNYLNLLYREQRRTGSMKYVLLYTVFGLNLGLFIYLILTRFYGHVDLSLSLCIVIVLVVYGLRHFVMRYLGYIYPFDKEVGQFSFTIIIFNILLGLLLLPIDIFVAFSPPFIAKIAAYTGIALISLIFIFRQLRGLFISSRLLVSNQFYFFLYLCAVEITPWLLLIGLVGDVDA